MFEWGKKDTPRPYKTYSKRIIIHDTADHFSTRLMDIQLWLTTFNVVITVQSTRDQPMLNITEEELDRKIYPKIWYNQNGGGNVSVNDLRRQRENQENLYGDITFSLEINPNASPWYIKLPNAQTERPDIAVAALYCKHFEKKSIEEGKLNISTFAGSAEPLYFTAFEKDDTLKFNAELDQTAKQLINELSEVRRNDIWNKPYYLRLHSTNIGSRRKTLNINQQDDQIRMTFLMPLFVIGSLDVLVPKEIIPAWDPPEPYRRKFG